MSVNVPVHVNIAHARLPQTYEAAKTALANCERIDECKDWADKASALASYARQADDDSLLKVAQRIKARAVRRCGELLKQYDGRGRPSKNVHPKVDNLSQTEMARRSGIGKKRQENASRIANIAKDDFDAAIERDLMRDEGWRFAAWLSMPHGEYSVLLWREAP